MIPVVVGSNPIGHPTSPRKWQAPKLDCGDSPETAYRLLVGAALTQIRSNLGGAIAGSDPEHLHQLRVGIRRLRTVLLVFKAKQLGQRLRKLARPLGEARDWDVFVACFGRGKPQQRAAHARCRRVLESSEFTAFLVEVRRSDREIREAPLAAFAAGGLDRLHRKTLKRAHGIDWRDEKKRHSVRIALRRLRYASDFFSSCFGDARRYLRGLADLQDLLGDLNDIAVARRLGGPPAALGRRERTLVRELVPAWQAFEKRPRFWIDRGRPPAAAS